MLNIKYVYPRGNTFYWQRKIPCDLVARYPATGTLKINLQTTSPATIAAKVGALNRQHEALWDAMRNDLTLSPKPIRDAARDLLKAHGLPANGRGADEDALFMFIDTLDIKRRAHAALHDDPEATYRDAFLSDLSISVQ